MPEPDVRRERARVDLAHDVRPRRPRQGHLLRAGPAGQPFWSRATARWSSSRRSRRRATATAPAAEATAATAATAEAAATAAAAAAAVMAAAAAAAATAAAAPRDVAATDGVPAARAQRLRGVRAGARHADVRQRDQRGRCVRPARPVHRGGRNADRHRRRLRGRPLRADHRPLAGPPGGSARARGDRHQGRASPPPRTRTGTACPVATWRPPWTRHCGGSASRPSTSTSCTAGIR